MNPVRDVESIGRGIAHEFLSVKSLAIGLGVFFVSAWLLSRLLPGAAARAGLIPRPIYPSGQNIWPEPIGLTPLSVYLNKYSAGTSSTAATTTTPASDAGSTLASITQ